MGEGEAGERVPDSREPVAGLIGEGGNVWSVYGVGGRRDRVAGECTNMWARSRVNGTRKNSIAGDALRVPVLS
jgi:hypothetical protein